MSQTTPRAARNRLAEQTSPYLLQHADNPVDWYPWGPEALARARSENKPILLSIGYSACHWCHVMAHESFADPDTAELMNQLFVNIKVDREERPDLDRIYQTAHQLLTQSGGGWPLTVFLAPATQTPFFTGTYFPPQARHGMPPFRTVLRRVAEFYATRGNELAAHGSELVAAMHSLLPAPEHAPGVLPSDPQTTARTRLQQEFDREFGGSRGTPKFPQPAHVELLLRLWRATADDEQPDLQALYMATLTATRMAEGGLYDQLGGGFYRYSVDEYWMIPHFEKMLYDNGQLLATYSQLAVATGDPLFHRVTAETADWLQREMADRSGGFHAALDADCEGREGHFYVWRREQVQGLLEPQQYAVFERRYGLDRDANFEGQWHLHCFRPMAEIAAELQLSQDAAETLLEQARATLRTVRERRVRPSRDEKILTGWNGLAVAGLAAAARTLADARHADAALAAARFLHSNCWREGRLLAVCTNGQGHLPAYLDDHAFLAWGLLELLQSHWDDDALFWCVDLAETMLSHFEDTATGGFFFTADDHETLLLRPKSFADEATPSGNGMAARLLIRLGFLLGETRYLQAAERTLRAAWADIARYPQGHASLLMALDELSNPPTVVVIRGERDAVDQWRSELDKSFDSRRLIFAIHRNAPSLPEALAQKRALGSTTAYVCHGTRCSPPLQTMSDLVRGLRG